VRIVVAHSRYRSASSGENQVVDDEARLLEAAGHEVSTWQPSPEQDEHGLSLLKTGLGTVWSSSAARGLRKLLRETGAEVLHFHNLFPMLSPAALRIAREEHVAVVMTLHNYRMLCLPASLLREGRVCEDCVGHVPWRGVRHACYRDSTLGSASLALSLSLHRALRTFDRPQLLLAVSEFVRQKHVDAGWDPERIRVKANFAWPCDRRSGPGESFVFVGRLSPEKGLAHLLETWRRIDAQLLVIGDGPDREQLRRLAPPNVHFTGSVERAEVDEMLQRARALILPSICYEGQPRTILEAFAAGVPVIASRMGGLPELVVDGASGRLVEPEDEDGWRTAVEQLNDDAQAEQLGAGALRLWQQRYSPSVAINALERAYEDALARLRS
jgi:glycosyltransferase involved in cell wall biosynthesis